MYKIIQPKSRVRMAKLESKGTNIHEHAKRYKIRQHTSDYEINRNKISRKELCYREEFF